MEEGGRREEEEGMEGGREEEGWMGGWMVGWMDGVDGWAWAIAHVHRPPGGWPTHTDG